MDKVLIGVDWAEYSPKTDISMIKISGILALIVIFLVSMGACDLSDAPEPDEYVTDFVVEDSETGELIEGAKIHIPNFNIEEETDADGHLEIEYEALQDESFEYTVTKENYVDYKGVYRAGDEEVEFELKPIVTKVEEIEVIAQPEDMEYYEEEELVLEGLEVELIYDDTNTEEVELTDFDDYGLITEPEEGKNLTVADHDEERVEIEHELTGATAITDELTVKERSEKTYFRVENAETDPIKAAQGEEVKVTADIENIGDGYGEQDIELYVEFADDEVLIMEEDLAVEAGGTKIVEYKDLKVPEGTEAKEWSLEVRSEDDKDEFTFTVLQVLAQFNIDADDEVVQGENFDLTIDKFKDKNDDELKPDYFEEEEKINVSISDKSATAYVDLSEKDPEAAMTVGPVEQVEIDTSELEIADNVELAVTVGEVEEFESIDVVEGAIIEEYDISLETLSGEGEVELFWNGGDEKTVLSEETDSETFEEGTEVNVTAEAGDGWVLEEWIEDLSGEKEGPIDLMVDEDYRIGVVFKEAKHTVTFSEEDKLEGVEITVFEDEDREEHVFDMFTTDENGVARKDFVDGEYWFTAVLDNYENFKGGFDVEGEDILVEFDLTPLTTEITGLVKLEEAEYVLEAAENEIEVKVTGEAVGDDENIFEDTVTIDDFEKAFYYEFEEMPAGKEFSLEADLDEKETTAENVGSFSIDLEEEGFKAESDAAEGPEITVKPYDLLIEATEFAGTAE